MLVGVGIMLIVVIGLVRSLGNAVRQAELIADGDLSNEIKVDGKDEVSRLLQAFDLMQKKTQGRYWFDQSGSIRGGQCGT